MTHSQKTKVAQNYAKRMLYNKFCVPRFCKFKVSLTKPAIKVQFKMNIGILAFFGVLARHFMHSGGLGMYFPAYDT